MSFEQDLRDAHKIRHAKFFPPKAAPRPKPAPKLEPPKLPTHKRVVAITDSDEPSQPLVIKTYTSNDWRPTISEVRFIVCQHFGITLLELDRKIRTMVVCRRRQIAMYLCVKLTHHSMPHIARRFGNFDHTTVHHANLRIQALRNTQPELDQEIQALEQQLMRVP